VLFGIQRQRCANGCWCGVLYNLSCDIYMSQCSPCEYCGLEFSTSQLVVLSNLDACEECYNNCSLKCYHCNDNHTIGFLRWNLDIDTYVCGDCSSNPYRCNECYKEFTLFDIIRTTDLTCAEGDELLLCSECYSTLDE